MSFHVYQIEIQVGNNAHHLIFVETGDGGAGESFQVRRVNRRQDMVFERSIVEAPGLGALSTFRQRDYIGRVRTEKLDMVESVCRSVAPPAVQYSADGACNCIEWLHAAKTALKMSGLIQP